MRLKKLPYRRSAAVLQLFLLLAFTLQPLAFAFKQPFHEQVTESRLQGAGFDTDSADEVGDSNYYTDVAELLSDAAHGDNNQLAASSARLRQKRTEIGDALNACERRRALDTFGEALHTVQDLHSHTNSLDNGIPFGDILNLSNGTASCSVPGFAPGGLVSGYFNAIGGTSRLQCFRMPANMCCHYDLNKDEPGAPNGANHAAALSRAGAETLSYLSLVEDDIRARFGEPKATQFLKMFKKKQRTTYFVIDDTGSMGNDIAGVRAAANAFLDQIIAGDEAPTLGLVTFKDSPNDRGITCDLETLRSQINSLFASGGDDCPEAMNAGLLAALSHFPLIGSDMQLRGGRILLATDASAGDSGSGPAVAVQSALKGVSIDAILTGDCEAEESATSLAAGTTDGFTEASENEPVEGLAPSPLAAAPDAVDPLTSISARTYLRALTDLTGGVLFNVSRLEVDDVVPTLLELSKPDTAILLSRKVELTSGVPFSLQVPIDDTLRDKVTFMVTASRSGILPTFTLKRPDGSVVGAGDPGVTIRSLSSVRSYTVTAPATGRWEAQLSGAGSFVLRVFGATPFRLNSVRLLNRSVLEFQRPEIDFVPLDGQPVVGDDVFADLRFTDAPTALNASVVQPDGAFLASLSPVPLDGFRRFRADLQVPATTFLVETTGLTPGGTEFVRQVSVPATPQTVAVSATPEQSIVAPGAAATVQVSVRNAGTEETTFRLLTTSTLPWSVTGPATVTVAAGATTTVGFNVNVPAGTFEGQQTTVIFFAEALTDTRIRNSATVGVAAGTDNQSPVCTGATASPLRLWPPNHNLIAIGIQGVTDPDNDPIDITVDGITQDEPVLGNGSGNTAPDADGVGTSTPRVRAERSGGGDGRVYSISFRATDGHGGSCSGAVRVGVPHNQNGSAVDSGQSYDSTSSTP